MQDLYKVIVVDDEFIIRDGLMSFKWEKHGFSLVGGASDGSEAFELMEKNQADLIITDIKMPVMDGLALSQKIYESFPSTKVIILTGYKEFDYALTALRTGVVEYLLKPVDLDELEVLIDKIKNELDEIHSKEKLLCSYERRLKESVPMAVENFLRGIVEEKITDMNEIEETMNILEIYLKRPFYSCAVFKAEVDSPDFSQRIKPLLINRLNYQMSLLNLGFFYFNSTMEVVFILNFEQPESQISTFDYLTDTVQNIRQIFVEAFSDYKDLSISAGVGSIYNNLLYLSASYKQAQMVLQRKFFSESSELFFAWKEKSIDINTIIDYPYEKEDSLITAVLEGEKDRITPCFTTFWEDITLVLKQKEPNYFKALIVQLINTLERRLNKHGTGLSEIAKIDPPFSDFIDLIPSLSKMRSSIETIFVKASEHVADMNSSVKSPSHNAVMQAVKYIKEHYNEKITLNEISEKVFLNPSYFSVQFKKEIGKNFVDYIKEVRIEKAKELLKRIDLKAYEVSEIIGYQDYAYFTETFKELTGLSPVKYRQKLVSN
jgi:two-component system response regulator YesN